MDQPRILYIHGSDSTGKTYKAQVLQKQFPDLIAPDFSGPLAVRLSQLTETLSDQSEWVLIGSSLGGLMAAWFTCQHPAQIRKVILLAPALHLPEFSRHLPEPVSTIATLIIGKKDDVIPINSVLRISRRIFTNLFYRSVDDDHRLHYTTDTMDWKTLLS
jgi:alpha-beta hydrolase superfamily lysophospholipase